MRRSRAALTLASPGPNGARPVTPLSPSQTSGPISSAERILVLDIVRGVALLGIFIMNVPGFSHSLFAGASGVELVAGPLDRAAALLREELFAGKFNSMFSLLFGIGFTIQLGRLRATQPARATLIYVRRLLVLAAIGLVHAGLLWSGDVLLVYAVLGFALLVLRPVPDAVLIALIVACLMFPAFFEIGRSHLVSPQAEALAAFDYQDLETSNNLAFGQGSFIDAASETARMLAWGYGTPMGRWSYALFYAQMGTGLLLGYLAGRHRWVQHVDDLMPQVRRTQGAALALSVAGSLVYLATKPGVFVAEPTPTIVFIGMFLHTASRLALMVFYVLTLVRLTRSVAWQRRLLPFAAAGRMPLTNYLLQTAMGTFIFYGWGLGLWGQAGAALEIGLAAGLFIFIQLPLSVWWFSRFRYGPLEYVWRVLSYGRSMA